MRLSVIIPCFDEQNTIYEVLKRISAVSIPGLNGLELIVVDDASRDATPGEIRRFADDHPQVNLRVLRHNHNTGKGAAIHTGLRHSTGEWVIVQDADLEYNPADFARLFAKAEEGNYSVVYGSRFSGRSTSAKRFHWHRVGNRLLTRLSNLFTGLSLTDMETCYKLFWGDLIRNLKLREKRFGFEPEVTARISRIPGIRVGEVPISYERRDYAAGKKIGWRDGLRALYCILRYRWVSEAPVRAGSQPLFPGSTLKTT